ncbi:hypothetical protein [Jannaschia sp. W003]|uniref:hypothetical protein n=1 Tax=Jannaschia sp. W003 TaxID=2867012 RepID=UPI0021A60D74|nr:hypothetical protein [Jannaschia sp. W003]UWQ21609.1 hypothetical protein K3554_00855 [Jannaschia sp. W003]
MRPLLLVLLLGACQPGPAPETARGLALVPAAGGLDVAGSGGREIGFGRDRLGAIESAAKVTGLRPRAVACAAPGRDAVRFGELEMVFERGAFTGWRTPEGAAGAACGGTV